MIRTTTIEKCLVSTLCQYYFCYYYANRFKIKAICLIVDSSSTGEAVVLVV